MVKHNLARYYTERLVVLLSLMRPNHFNDGFCRIGPFESPHSIIEGNVFNRTMAGLLISAELTWLSGNLGISNVSIHGNIFEGCCPLNEAGYDGQCNGTVPIFNPAHSTDLHLWHNTIQPTPN